ncbi:MAG: efflux RND transporter permease subunit [Planctomycetaceae bacterium]
MHGGDAAGPATRWRLRLTLAVATCTILAILGISRLRMDDDLRSLLRDGDDEFVVIDEIAARFGAPDRDCIVRAAADGGDLFRPVLIDRLRRLATALRAVDGVEEVRSVFDVRRQGAAGALLTVIPRTAEPLGEESCDAARRRCLDHPLVGGHLLSADASATLLLVRLASGRDSPAAAAPIIAAIADTIAAARGDGLQLELTGLPVLNAEASAALRRDMLVFNSLGLVLAVVLSASVARSLRSTLVASLPPAIGAVWAMGVLGLCGARVNILTSVVPSLALVVGTCDSIHFIEDMRRSRRRGLDALSASSGAMRRIGPACGLTSLVTAIGFASLAAARIEAVRTFGIAAAAGAVASFAAVTLITPLLASLSGFDGAGLGRSSRLASRASAAAAAWSVRHARPIAAAGLAATVLLALAGARLDADNRVADALPRGAASSRALLNVDEQFGGAFGADIIIAWPEGLEWRDAEVIDGIAAVHGVLAETGADLRAVSLATVAGTVGDRARRRLDPEDFADLVAPEDRLAVVRIRVRDEGSRALEGVYDRIDAGLARLSAERPGWRYDLAGMSVLSARNVRQLVRDLGSSLLLEVTVICVILAVAFRSPLAGIVSMVPNVFPLAVIAALMVATRRHLDPATVIVFNVCLGLAVDDTVHVLAAIGRRRGPGVGIASAIRRGMAETGNAIVLGGVVLAVGFAAVTVSSVPSLAGFGILACAAVAAATVAELVMLPALLVVTESLCRRFPPPWPDRIFGLPSSPGPASPPARPLPGPRPHGRSGPRYAPR